MNIQIFKPLLKNNEKKHYALQKTVNELAKDGLLQCNMPSFASRFTAYWQALDLQPLTHNRKMRQKQAKLIDRKQKKPTCRFQSDMIGCKDILSVKAARRIMRLTRHLTKRSKNKRHGGQKSKVKEKKH